MDWQWLITNVGVLGTILVAIFFAAYKFGWWLMLNAVQPIVTAHIDYLKKMGEVAESMGGSIARLADAQQEAAASQREAADDLRRMATDLTEVKKKVVIHAETAVISSRPDGGGGQSHGPGASSR